MKYMLRIAMLSVIGFVYACSIFLHDPISMLMTYAVIAGLISASHVWGKSAARAELPQP